MNIQMHAPWEINTYLREQIETKLEKLTALSPDLIHADVFLKMGAGKDHSNDKELEVRLRLPGPEIFAVADAETYEKALAAVVQKLRRQLTRRKELRISY